MKRRLPTNVGRQMSCLCHYVRRISHNQQLLLVAWHGHGYQPGLTENSATRRQPVHLQLDKGTLRLHGLSILLDEAYYKQRPPCWSSLRRNMSDPRQHSRWELLRNMFANRRSGRSPLHSHGCALVADSVRTILEASCTRCQSLLRLLYE